MNFSIFKTTKFFIAASLLLCGLSIGESHAQPYSIAQTPDFTVTGDGSNPNWEKAGWLNLERRRAAADVNFRTRLRALYSDTGIYFLFDCEDKVLTSTMDADFMELWTEDVAEVFLMPDENHPAYFEYEISPMNYELVLLLSNVDGEMVRWRPWYYDTDVKVAHQTSVTGGEKRSLATVDGWKAEFFIPFALLRPLHNLPPKKGDVWKANFYRVDHDGEGSGSWSWQATVRNFHDFKSFGSIVFE